MAEMSVKLKPFPVPDRVFFEWEGTKQDGPLTLPSLPLEKVDLRILEQLCSEFRANVLRKAGHGELLRDF